MIYIQQKMNVSEQWTTGFEFLHIIIWLRSTNMHAHIEVQYFESATTIHDIMFAKLEYIFVW